MSVIRLIFWTTCSVVMLGVLPGAACPAAAQQAQQIGQVNAQGLPDRPHPQQLAQAAIPGLPAPPPAGPSALTWEQVKAKFEAANPVLKSDQSNVDEMKAEEITAYLRPNPQFTMTADGTSIAPHDGIYQPTKGTFLSAQLQLSARARSQARAAPAERAGRHPDCHVAA